MGWFGFGVCPEGTSKHKECDMFRVYYDDKLVIENLILEDDATTPSIQEEGNWKLVENLNEESGDALL